MSIICPHCGKEQSLETMYFHVTYWGDDKGFVQEECEFCEKTFLVKEVVVRTFDVKKIECLHAGEDASTVMCCTCKCGCCEVKK